MSDKPELRTCKASEFTYDSTIVSVADAKAYAQECVLAERQRCAVIAEDHENWRDNPAYVIAAKIREGTP